MGELPRVNGFVVVIVHYDGWRYRLYVDELLQVMALMSRRRSKKSTVTSSVRECTGSRKEGTGIFLPQYIEREGAEPLHSTTALRRPLHLYEPVMSQPLLRDVLTSDDSCDDVCGVHHHHVSQSHGSEYPVNIINA